MTEQQMTKSGPLTTIEDLMDAARTDTDASWEDVDVSLPHMSQNPLVIDWAEGTGLYHPEGTLRDLGVSILEKAKGVKLHEATIPRLLEIMRNDEVPHVRSRASFTLFVHGERTSEVIAQIREAINDPSLTEIAEGYLQKAQNA